MKVYPTETAAAQPVRFQEGERLVMLDLVCLGQCLEERQISWRFVKWPQASSPITKG